MEEAFFTDELRSELYCYGTETLSKADFPLDYAHISRAQQKDKKLLKLRDKKESPYETQTFMSAGKEIPVVCYNGKMVIPSSLQQWVIEWYHTNRGDDWSTPILAQNEGPNHKCRKKLSGLSTEQETTEKVWSPTP